jgi:hypothetical protein
MKLLPLLPPCLVFFVVADMAHNIAVKSIKTPSFPNG